MKFQGQFVSGFYNFNFNFKILFIIITSKTDQPCFNFKKNDKVVDKSLKNHIFALSRISPRFFFIKDNSICTPERKIPIFSVIDLRNKKLHFQIENFSIID